ncbi:MAG: NADPH-dependent F420 reductase [Steroidobacteraceae bacterium]
MKFLSVFTASVCALNLMFGSFAALAQTPAARPAAQEPIAIIGTGSVGGALGKRWAALGHPIIYGSRDPGRSAVRELVAQSGKGAIALHPADALMRADIVLFAVPWEAAQESARSLGDVSGKVVIDVTNPLVTKGDKEVVGAAVPESGARLIQGWLPGATVVKAFNVVNWRIMEEPARAGGAVTIPIASDDAPARLRVAKLAEALGFEAFDVGSLGNARYLEGMAILYVNMLLQDPPRRFEYYFRRPH